ncbi:MAG: putative zinc-binding metallopeptidase [Bacteroidales bacterium]|nr:putative zinc-binding metallopeptidase [Bacteroidales bacterium]
MKKIIYILAVSLSIAVLSSCEKEVLSDRSVITVEEMEQTELDKWLTVNFLNPYNIDFVYRFSMNESDMNYYTIPPRYELAVKMAHLVKYLCIDTYDEVAGIEFTRSYFPKMFFLIGEWEYRNNGTFILGTAEGGKKILLSGINYLDEYGKDAEGLNFYYIKTIHHEFTHILNQTRSYPQEFAQVNGNGYVADSWSEPPYNTEYLKNGFFTAYSQENDAEDFAELMSEYVTHTQEYWDSEIAKAGDGKQYINRKLDIVRSYMLDTWGIDMDVLRATILRRQNDVTSGKIDLQDLTIR